MWFYRVGSGGRAEGKLVNRRDYMGGGVASIKLGATQAAVLVDGKVVVHPIEVRRVGGMGGALGRALKQRCASSLYLCGVLWRLRPPLTKHAHTAVSQVMWLCVSN